MAAIAVFYLAFPLSFPPALNDPSHFPALFRDDLNDTSAVRRIAEANQRVAASFSPVYRIDGKALARVRAALADSRVSWPDMCPKVKPAAELARIWRD